MVGAAWVSASVCAVLLLSSPVQGQQEDSLHHHGITVNFDTEDCDLGHHEKPLFSVFQSFTLNIQCHVFVHTRGEFSCDSNRNFVF